MTKLLSPARRRWAYRVTGAALIVAGIYGLIDGAQRDAWLILAGALFGVADRHVDDSAQDAE